MQSPKMAPAPLVLVLPQITQRRGEVEALPVTVTTGAQGVAWRHHTGFNFQIINELKSAVSQYGTTAPFTLAILECAAEEWLTLGIGIP